MLPQIPTEVSRILREYERWRRHCSLPIRVAWSAKALGDERERIHALLAGRLRFHKHLAWDCVAAFVIGGVLAYVFEASITIAACGAAVFTLLVSLLKRTIAGRRIPTKDLQEIVDALEPLSADRPIDGDLARLVDAALRIDDSRYGGYAHHAQKLREVGRLITRLECLDLLMIYQCQLAEEALARRREADDEAIQALTARTSDAA
jgi:hypothetical protein